ncbi:toxin-antitoxin system HicB family antitoxin [Blastomonas sp.]|uniref:toxin-antitoxin system HicB family antitoxin n=1 Tax=Blastomonas sp. TaxID=1909299 RepID=UPI0035936F33
MPASPKKPFALRIEPSLYDALERAAAHDLRSVNAQIEVLLREGLARRGVKLAAPENRPRGRPVKHSD